MRVAEVFFHFCIYRFLSSPCVPVEYFSLNLQCGHCFITMRYYEADCEAGFVFFCKIFDSANAHARLLREAVFILGQALALVLTIRSSSHSGKGIASASPKLPKNLA
jgi:hypothetical protein